MPADAASAVVSPQVTGSHRGQSDPVPPMDSCSVVQILRWLSLVGSISARTALSTSSRGALSIRGTTEWFSAPPPIDRLAHPTADLRALSTRSAGRWLREGPGQAIGTPMGAWRVARHFVEIGDSGPLRVRELHGRCMTALPVVGALAVVQTMSSSQQYRRTV